MRAELIRSAIEEYVPKTGVDDKSESFRLQHIKAEIEELERLAEIGKAVEAATFELRPWIIGHNRGPYLYPSNEEIQELISWHRGE